MSNTTNNVIRFPIKSAAAVALAVALLSTAYTSYAADYYRWTDENGVVHMTDKKPENRSEVEVLKSRAPVPRSLKDQEKDAVEAAAAEEAELAEKAAKEANAPQAVDLNAPRELRCQQERERLSILQANKVVHMQDANGQLKTLSESDIQREIATTQKAIDALCD